MTTSARGPLTAAFRRLLGGAGDHAEAGMEIAITTGGDDQGAVWTWRSRRTSSPAGWGAPRASRRAELVAGQRELSKPLSTSEPPPTSSRPVLLDLRSRPAGALPPHARVVKVTSPMNVGRGCCSSSGGASNTAAVLELLGPLRPVKLAAEAVSPLRPGARYLQRRARREQAIPVWHEVAASCPASSGERRGERGRRRLDLHAPGRRGPARRLAVAGVLARARPHAGDEASTRTVGEVTARARPGSSARRRRGSRPRLPRSSPGAAARAGPRRSPARARLRGRDVPCAGPFQGRLPGGRDPK